MARDPASEFDDEVKHLVLALNRDASGLVAQTIPDAESVWDRTVRLIPHARKGDGIDWEKAVHSSGPYPDEPREQPEEIARRIQADFAELCQIAKLKSDDWVSFISDDLYSIGLACNVATAPQVLAAWLPLPHAILIIPDNNAACLVVMFARSSYLFAA